MIQGGIDKVIEWLDSNGIESWSVSTSKDKQTNNYIFKSNDEASVKDEQARMIHVLSLSSNPNLFIFGKKKGASNSANYCEMFSNNNTTVFSETSPTSAIGMVNQDTINTMVANAVERERMSWERKELDREREEVRAMRKEYEEQTASVVGLLIKKAAPIIQSVMGVAPQVAIGSVEKEISAEPIRVRKTEPVEVQEERVEEIEEQEVFSDEESDELFSIVERWKNVDPDYITVIRRIVEFAESGEPIEVAGGLVKLNYEQIKGMIL